MSRLQAAHRTFDGEPEPYEVFALVMTQLYVIATLCKRLLLRG